MIYAQNWNNASKYERTVFQRLATYEQTRYKTEKKEFEERAEYTPIEIFKNFEQVKIDVRKEIEEQEGEKVDKNVKTSLDQPMYLLNDKKTDQ